MTNRELKRRVRRFRRENRLYTATYLGLRTVIEKQGYTLIEFNNVLNEQEVMNLVDALDLSDYVMRSKGFTYTDNHYRLIFVHEGLSELEKTVVLAHEIGHIVCGHFTSAPIIGKDVQDEYEANEFAHYLLNPGSVVRTHGWCSKHKGWAAAILVMTGLCVIGLGGCAYARNAKRYVGDYYVTASGTKYHEKTCVFVKNKKNVKKLTVEQFETGEYEPCQMCLP